MAPAMWPQSPGIHVPLTALSLRGVRGLTFDLIGTQFVSCLCKVVCTRGGERATRSAVRVRTYVFEIFWDLQMPYT